MKMTIKKRFSWVDGKARRFQRNYYHAHKLTINSEVDVLNAVKQLKEEIGGSTYSLYAYVCDGNVEGYCDSGERYCGPRLLNMLRNSEVKNVLVMVFASWHGNDNVKLERIQLICNVAHELIVKGE